VPVTQQLRQDGPGGAAANERRAAVVARQARDHHIQRRYGKAGVSTRAGATLVTLEHGLVRLD
jgi:hypothetical protein